MRSFELGFDGRVATVSAPPVNETLGILPRIDKQINPVLDRINELNKERRKIFGRKVLGKSGLESSAERTDKEKI